MTDEFRPRLADRPATCKPGVRFSSQQKTGSHRRYEKQVDVGALAEYLCRHFAVDGYQTQAIDTGPGEAAAQIMKVGKLRAVLGLRECLTIRMHVIETGTFVEMGKAAWVDKVVGLAGGFALTLVPFFTAPFGIYNQHKLREKAWALVENFIGA